MPKISISIPAEILDFVDQLGDNRSGAIVAILEDYKNRQREAELVQAYQDYEQLREPDDGAWEAAAARDAVREA